MPARLKSSDVFINCPFDPGYQPIFNAILFAVYDLGFVARCALEEEDADAVTSLPRFNMPLELGLFLGCKRYGPNKQNAKRSLVLDSDQNRYKQFISDISGQDIRAHGGDPERAICAVRDWLQASSKRTGVSGGGEIVKRYRRFQIDLPTICSGYRLEPDRLTFIDLSTLISDWLRTNR